MNSNTKEQMDKAINVKMTDEQEYQMLKENDRLGKDKDNDLLSAREWKKRRLNQIKKEGRVWS